MKKIQKIENFLISIAIVLGFFITFNELNKPKKKDYLGRIILSLLGFVLFIFSLSVFMAIMHSLFT